MRFKKYLSEAFWMLREYRRRLRVECSSEFMMTRLQGKIVRHTQSLEQGLSVPEPKPGFKEERARQLLQSIDLYFRRGFPKNHFSVYMAVDALNAYLSFHEKRKYDVEFLSELKRKLQDIEKHLQPRIIEAYGGTKLFCKRDLVDTPEVFERFFTTRHSIRDFDSTPVDREKLMKAIQLAQYAPSACNRQGVRVYVIEGRKLLKDTAPWLDSIGDFSASIDKFLIIAAKQSIYDISERYQYVVNASIYAAYLSLTLHAMQIGSCVIQRPVTQSKKWEEIRKMYKIAADEQIIMLIGIGNLKEETVVPVSYRLPYDALARYIS